MNAPLTQLVSIPTGAETVNHAPTNAVVLLFDGGDSLVAAGLDRDEAEAALLSEHIGDDLEVGVTETAAWAAGLDAVVLNLAGPAAAVSAVLALLTVNQRAGVVLGAGLEAEVDRGLIARGLARGPRSAALVPLPWGMDEFQSPKGHSAETATLTAPN
jgi:hypothetical protein